MYYLKIIDAIDFVVFGNSAGFHCGKMLKHELTEEEEHFGDNFSDTSFGSNFDFNSPQLQ